MTKLKKDAQNNSKIKRLHIPVSTRNSTYSDSAKNTEARSESLKNADRKIEIESLRINSEDLNNLEKFKLPEIKISVKKVKVQDKSQNIIQNINKIKNYAVFQNFETNNENLKTSCFPSFSSEDSQELDSQEPTDLSNCSEVKTSNANLIFENQNILLKWEKHNSFIKKRTKIICEKIKRNPANSVINSEIRTKNEVAQVLQQLIPQVTLTPTTHGFFKLPDRICKMDNYSTWMTLTKTEKGNEQFLEQIGYSNTICDELNYAQNVMNKKIREKNKIYETFKNYKEIFEEIEGHYPEFDNLEIKGIKISSDRFLDFQKDFLFAAKEPFGQLSNSLPKSEKCQGLSLLIAGKTLIYTGPEVKEETEMFLEARVLFECFQGEKTISYLEIENNGTTAVYYNWELVNNKDVCGIPLKNMGVQTFYFDQSDGVLIPGEKINFPFTFKAVKDGIYQEKWLLKTIPSLNSGLKVCVVLHGISVQKNIYQKIKNDQIKMEYEKKRDKYICGIIMNVVDNVKPILRPVTPVEQTLTVQEKFEKTNQNYFFNDEQFIKLNSLCNKEVEWDYSLEDLYDKILNSLQKNDKQAQLLHFHNCLKKMKKPSKFFSRILRTNIMYLYLSLVFSKMEHTADIISTNSKYIKKLYEEKSVAKIEGQKQGKKRGSFLPLKGEQTERKIQDSHVYFTNQSREMMKKTTYNCLLNILDMIDEIYLLI